ncbi:AI-2E family transporter [bacterium]|nr:AI-2E family transporter [bacterium]
MPQQSKIESRAISDGADSGLSPGLRKTLAILAIAALSVFILRQVGPILTSTMQVIGPFLLALIVAYVFHPVVLFVQRELKLGRVTGILVLAGLIVLALSGILLWLVPKLYQQMGSALSEMLSWLIAKVDEWGANYLDPSTRNALKESLRGDLGNINELLKRVAGAVPAPGRAVATGSVAAVLGVAGGVASLGAWIGSMSVVAIIVFYLLVDFHRIPGVIRRLLPEAHRERTWEVLVKADRAVGGFLRGQLIVCMINGSLMALILMLVGLRQYAILIGFIAGILNFVPYLGPIAGFLPGALWIVFSKQYPDWNARGAWLAVLVAGFMAIQAIEGFILQPYIVGKRASLHPLMIIAAFIIGAQAGFGGMIVAVPMAAVVKVLWVELYWKDR